MRKTDSVEKTLMLGKIEVRMTEDEMVGWHHQLNGHELEWTPGVGDGQGGLACCSPRGRQESDTTGWLNNNIDSGNVKWCIQFRKQFRSSSKS